VHGWNQPAAVNVNIANIPMPPEEERAEMRELDRKLDAFAAMLKRSSTARAGGLGLSFGRARPHEQVRLPATASYV
jgi:hypothetical protein